MPPRKIKSLLIPDTTLTCQKTLSIDKTAILQKGAGADVVFRLENLSLAQSCCAYFFFLVEIYDFIVRC
jgi:hypothetical protein